ncbi:hypothetical protein G3I24_49390, partial [Micromonospora aurantiaca]|nr:hypothetical protein [Micromonospora aurantiaca]
MTDAIILQDAVDSFLDDKNSLSSEDLAELWWSIFDRNAHGAEDGLEHFFDLLSVNV